MKFTSDFADFIKDDSYENLIRAIKYRPCLVECFYKANILTEYKWK